MGTEQGTVFTINKKKDEGGEVSQTKFGFKWGRHLGPIIAMQRCPDSLKYFLTVGDWTARVIIFNSSYGSRKLQRLLS